MIFGNGSITRGLFRTIRSVIPDGSSILEFGSGTGTKELVNHYKVTSIEHNKEWLNKIPGTTYKYVPIQNGYYNVDKLVSILEEQTFDAILIDGPNENRSGILGLLPLLLNQVSNGCKTIIFDDINRTEEHNTFFEATKILSSLLRLVSIGTHASIHSSYLPWYIHFQASDGGLRQEESGQGGWGVLEFDRIPNEDRFVNVEEILALSPEWLGDHGMASLITSCLNFDKKIIKCWVDYLEPSADTPQHTLQDGWFIFGEEHIQWKRYGFGFDSILVEPSPSNDPSSDDSSS